MHLSILSYLFVGLTRRKFYTRSSFDGTPRCFKTKQKKTRGKKEDTFKIVLQEICKMSVRPFSFYIKFRAVDIILSDLRLVSFRL